GRRAAPRPSQLSSRDALDERAQRVVDPGEPVFGCGSSKPNAGFDLDDLRPEDPHDRAIRFRRCEPAEPAARAPRARPGEDRRHARAVGVLEVELEVVHLATATAVAVEELVVEHTEADVDLGHPCPMCDAIISGTAATAT